MSNEIRVLQIDVNTNNSQGIYKFYGTVAEWEAFLTNHRNGNEEFFRGVDIRSGRVITINPAHYASCEASEYLAEGKIINGR